MELGAAGVVPKEESFPILWEAIITATSGGRPFPGQDRHQLLRDLQLHRASVRARFARFEHLTRKEREVLRALSRGQSASVIAAEHYVSLSTVRSQIRSVLTKLGVSSQLAAVALANEAGWFNG